MSQTSWSAFKSSADYYEVMFDPAQRLEREGPLLRELLDSAPGKRVLDVACGTGHHALWFAEAGASVTACDISPEMIAVAQARRPHTRVQYVAADMRDGVPGTWDLAVCIGNSLSLLPTAQDLRRAVQRVAHSLSNGGRFFIQVLNFAHPDMQSSKHRVVHKRLGDVDLTAVKSLVPASGHVLLSLAFFAEKDGIFATAAESAVQIYIEDSLLDQAASDAGLRVEARYGGFDKSSFDAATSPDLLVVLRKDESLES